MEKAKAFSISAVFYLVGPEKTVSPKQALKKQGHGERADRPKPTKPRDEGASAPKFEKALSSRIDCSVQKMGYMFNKAP